MECNLNRISSYVRENLPCFFGVFCINQILNTVLTTVYVDLNGLSHGKYKEANVTSNIYGLVPVFACYLWGKKVKVKFFFLYLIGRM